jgi:hypothetical protein
MLLFCRFMLGLLVIATIFALLAYWVAVMASRATLSRSVPLVDRIYVS